MSNPFGTPRQQPRAPRPGNSRRVLVPTLITLAALLILGSVFTSVWTDRLWFKSVGYSDVFQTVLGTRVLLFAVLGLLFGLFVLANVVLAYRTRPEFVSVRRDDPATRYRAALTPILKPVLAVLTVVLVAFAGSVAAGQWDTFQMWRKGGSFGQKDAQFGKDIGFYVFDYPWFRFLLSYAFALVVVTVLLVAFVHYVYGGIKLAGKGTRFSRAAQVHLAVLFGLGVLLRAGSYYLDRYDLVINGSGYVDGAGYTDVHARIPSKNILIAVAIVCAILFFATIVIRSWTLPVLSLGLLLVTSILIGGIWPAIMQSFQVRPSQPDKEGPYIERNIEATRDAYDVADTEVTNYTAKTDLSAGELTQTAESRTSARLIDPTLVSPAFEQLQQVRGYYTMPDTLDVDRYKLGDDQTASDVIIAAREVDLNGLQDTQRNWANDHTVYTHGYGVVAARGNQRGPNGEPVWVEKDIPSSGEFDIQQPRIYFGENSPSYSIVGRPDGASPIEVDIPRGGGGEQAEGEENVTANEYDGKDGVSVGNLFNKVLYAFKFGEPNLVLSSRVNENSKILYDRNPRDRVAKVAPWLTADGDAYPAVVDGRIVWVVDAYTTSNQYPYSQHRSLEEATTDSLTQRGAQAVLPTDEINYMRNSVKAVVDAYDGTVDLYAWDDKDPILKTWMKVFPDAVKPKSEISPELLEHLRYPVDLFKVQRDVLTRYHVTNQSTFYEDGERWKTSEDPTNKVSKQPPYYLTTSNPNQPDPRFSLTSVFLPNNRQNLAAFVSVNSETTDAEDYGKMTILQLPSETQIPGPSQVANDFQTDPAVTQALLPFEQSEEATIRRGNLLTLPVGDGLLYVQPVYIQRSNAEGSYPVLQFVIASFGDGVGFGQTLDQALRGALGLEASDPGDTNPDDIPGGETDGGDGGETPATPGTPQSASQLLDQASREYEAAQNALEEGDLAEYQRRIDNVGRLVGQARDAVEGS